MKILRTILPAVLFLPMTSAVFAADVEISGDVTPSPPTSPVWSTGDLTLGIAVADNSTGTLAITGSGVVYNLQASVGSGSNSQGFVNVSGNGVWNADTIALGEYGTGTLNISGNGIVNNEVAILGGASGSAGVVNVSGSGAWDADAVFMGVSGTGTLDISENGYVRTNMMWVGYSNAAASVQIRGSGSMNNGSLFIGYDAPGTMVLNDHGALRTTILTIGTGTLSINDSARAHSDILYMAGGIYGPSGDAVATIEVNGGSLQADTFNLGGDPGLEDPNPSGHNAGTLKITAGEVWIGSVTPSFFGSGTSTLHYDVSGGSLTLRDDLVLGAGQMGGDKLSSQTLTLSGSGTVSSRNVSVSTSTGLSTEISVSGGTWIAAGTMAFGIPAADIITMPYSVGGDTTVEISGSATLLSKSGLIGAQTPGDTLVRMTGGSWTMTDELKVYGGTLLLNSGTITSVGGAVGGVETTPGNVEVNGGTWVNSSQFVTGGINAGFGTLKITDGSVSNTDAIIQNGGVVRVSGGTWTNSGTLSMGYIMPEGYANDAILQISGGTVSNGDATLGDTLGVAHASASGGRWTTTGTLTVGDRGGYGELAVSGSAEVVATAGVVVSGTSPITELAGNPIDPPLYAPATGVLNLNGGLLSTPSITKLGDDATVNFNGTVIQARQATSQFISGFNVGDLNLMEGGAIIDTNGFGIGIQTVLTGTGGLVKTGEGQLSLSGHNTYTGGTTIEAGTLQLGSASALGSTPSRLTIHGGTLDINGRDITVGTLSGGAGGVIQSGISGEYRLTINQVTSGTFGGSIQDGAGTLSVQKTGTGTLRVTGSSNYRGTTTLTQGFTEISGSGMLGTGDITIAEGTLAVAGASLNFFDTASAGTRTYINNGATENQAFGGSTIFYDTSTAGSAKFIANNGANGGRGGIISFTDHSDGGTAQFELYGGGRLTIAPHSAGTVSIGSLLGDGSVALGNNNLAIGTNHLSTLFSGSIASAGSITKVGTGTLTLTGVNTYSGGTRVERGILKVSGSGTLGSGTTTVAAGTSSAQIESMLFFNDTANAGAGAYVIHGATFPGAYGGLMAFYDNTSAGSAQITALSGSNAGSGGVIALTDHSDGGTAQIEVQGNGRLTIASHTPGTVSIGSLAGDGLVTLGANHLAIGTNHLSTTFAGAISEFGSLTKVGTGTLTITGSNTYSGGTRVNRGSLLISGLGALGSGTTTIASGTTAQIEAALLFRDSATAGSGTYVNQGANIFEAFGGFTGFYDDTSAGNAKLIALGGSNGGAGGMISFIGNSDGGTSQIEVYGNGRLSLTTHTADSVSIGSLAGDGQVLLGSVNLSIGSNNLSTTFSGAISDTGSLTKVGTGTLALMGRSTYSGGTEIHAGTLIISNVGTEHSTLGTGTLRVGAAGKLGGVGTVLGDTTVAGTLSPGNSPGSIHFTGALTLESTALLQMELGESSHDLLSVGGLLTYDGTLAITLSESYRPEVGETFALFDAASVAFGSQFDAILFDVAGYSGLMNYETGVLTITAVPEPSALALAAVALLGMARLRRRAIRHRSLPRAAAQPHIHR